MGRKKRVTVKVRIVVCRQDGVVTMVAMMVFVGGRRREEWKDCEHMVDQ